MIILTMAQLYAPVQRFSNVGRDPKVFFQTGVKGIGGSWIEGCGNQIQDLSVVCHLFLGLKGVDPVGSEKKSSRTVIHVSDRNP